MADEQRQSEEPGTDEAVAEQQPADGQVTAQEDEYSRFADDAGARGDDAGDYEEPAPELGNLHKD